MKKTKLIFIFLSLTFILSSATAQKRFKNPINFKSGTYYFNSTELYFFDDGINCYLFDKCRDIDSVFLNSAKNIKFAKDTLLKIEAYLFTDNYEYVSVIINDKIGWLQTEVPMDVDKKDFLKKFLKSPHYKSKSTYVEVIPFKDPQKIFISTTDDWFIGDIERKSIEYIGTKGGRFEACQMVKPKDCVKCYIDLGYGQEVWYKSDGKKKKVK